MLATYGTMNAAIRRLERDKSLPEKALTEVARRLQIRSPELRPAEILAALDRQGNDLAALRQRLFEFGGGDAPAVAALRRRAARAFDELRFDEAERLLGQVIELRRVEIAKRHEAQDLANDEAQVQLVMDLVAQARLAGSRLDSDRQIALFLEAIKDAPTRRPSIVPFVNGMLSQAYYYKALRLRDLAAAHAAEDILRPFRAELAPNFRFPISQGESEASLLLAELDPTRANLNNAVDSSRALYDTCTAKYAFAGNAQPGYNGIDFGECLASTGAPGIPVARDLLIRSTMLLGQLWSDDAAIAAAEPLLRDAVTDVRINTLPAQLVSARMRLGIVLSMRADSSEGASSYVQAITLFEEDLQKPVAMEIPELATMLRVNLAASYVSSGRYEDAILVADRALRDVDSSRNHSIWINLMATKANAHSNLVRGVTAEHHLREGLAAYRAVVTASPPLAPPPLLARFRVGFAQLATAAFARSGRGEDLEDARIQLQDADTAIDCSSTANLRAKFDIAQGDYVSQIAASGGRRFDLLATATIYEQAMVTADRQNDPWTWALATRRYAEMIGLSSWDEEQGGFGFVPDAIAAFDDVIAEYARRRSPELAIDTAVSEIKVFVTLAKGYSNKARRRALLDRAKFAANRLLNFGRQFHSELASTEAQRRLSEIDATILSEKLTRVRPVPFGRVSSPATPSCPAAM